MTPSRRKTLVYFALCLALAAAAVFWGGAPEAQAAKNNQKVPTLGRDFLIRRPVELNHTPSSGANWLSSSDQSRLVSASSYLRIVYAKDFRNKNNTPFSEDVVFGFANGDATLLDNQIQYSAVKNLVKSSRYALIL